MVGTETKKFRFSPKNEGRKIDFLHFLPNFLKICIVWGTNQFKNTQLIHTYIFAFATQWPGRDKTGVSCMSMIFCTKLSTSIKYTPGTKVHSPIKMLQFLPMYLARFVPLLITISAIFFPLESANTRFNSSYQIEMIYILDIKKMKNCSNFLYQASFNGEYHEIFAHTKNKQYVQNIVSNENIFFHFIFERKLSREQSSTNILYLCEQIKEK